jgi:hypothetical protein
MLKDCFGSLPLKSASGPDGRLMLWDEVRRKYVPATPEEFVRQQVVAYLNRQKGYPLSLMRSEAGIRIHGRAKRFDLIACNNKAEVLLLVECKAPGVPLNEQAFLQMSNYNTGLGAACFWLTNGELHLIIQAGDTGLNRLNDIPEYKGS